MVLCILLEAEQVEETFENGTGTVAFCNAGNVLGIGTPLEHAVPKLEPLINNYIAKYNAEYGQADRERKQAETMRSMRKTLDLLGIAARDQQEIMQLAAVAPVVLASVLKETWGNRRIKSPTRFILNRMRQAVPMSA